MTLDTGILNLFGFEGFIKKNDDENLSEEQSYYLKNEVLEKNHIDGTYFSGNYPSVYFKNITGFNRDSLNEICKIHKSIWNQRNVPFLYISSPTELRIYNCFEEPINPESEPNNLNSIEIARYSVNDTKKKLNKLIVILGKAAIDSGQVWKDEELIKNFNVSNRVDKKLLNNLRETKNKLQKRGVKADTIHNILMRSLFVLYLEDIKATDKKYYQQFKENAHSYFDILKDEKATYKLFLALEEKFNGDLFAITQSEINEVNREHLSIVSSCFWGNEVKTGQQTLWKIFDFSVIPIELLSEIYEIFLNKTDEEKSKKGEYYTPHSLVGIILNERLPWANEVNKEYDLKILDIACGSGIFLVESYRRLVDRWMYVNKKQPGFKDLENILVHSIFGFEVNPSSIKVASFSLYLALISHLDPKTIWQLKTTKFPNLIYDPKRKNTTRQGKNLFLQSSLSNIIKHQEKFDLIIGNPPFKSAKTGRIEFEASEYCKKHGFAQEMVLPFLHRASEFCNENGKVAIVSTSKILFNKSGGYKKFRQFLFQDNYVEAVFNFSALRKTRKGQGKNIFSDAIGPACVLFYKKETPEQIQHTITYVCPKPTERDRFSDRLVLDELDFFYLPRHECEKPNTTIWKIGMWGTENDFYLINKFIKGKSLTDYLTEKDGWYKGGGLKFLTPTKDRQYQNKDIHTIPIVEAKYITRYYTNKANMKSLNQTLTEKNLLFYLNFYNVSTPKELPNIALFRHQGLIQSYYSPHILIKEGLSKKRFCASFLNYDCCFKHTITGISFKKENLTYEELQDKTKKLKALTAFLNSKFASYFLFLTSISWGIERERVTTKDLLELPGLPFEIPAEKINELAQKVDEISEELAKDFPNKAITQKIENEIDTIIYQTLKLTERERYLIEDVLNYNLDLFLEGKNSPAYYPVNKNNDELKTYLKILCADINEHFELSGTTVWASIQKMPATNPMRLIAIHFTNEHKAGYIKALRNNSDVNDLIRKIDEYSYEKHSASVYFRKVVKYYDGDIIYITKPNQKRFWSRSLAMQDAKNIIIDILNMVDDVSPYLKTVYDKIKIIGNVKMRIWEMPDTNPNIMVSFYVNKGKKSTNNIERIPLNKSTFSILDHIKKQRSFLFKNDNEVFVYKLDNIDFWNKEQALNDSNEIMNLLKLIE